MQWGRFGLGVVFGGVTGAITTALIVWGISFWMVSAQERKASEGWKVAPVVVAEQDLERGAVVTFDKVSSRSVPVATVTQSVVKPGSVAYVMNQRLMVPMAVGQVLHWSYFADYDVKLANLSSACAKAMPESLLKSDRTNERIRARLARAGGK